MIRLVVAVFLFISLSQPVAAALDIRETTSEGGIKAWLVEDHSIPFVALEIRFRGGTSLDLKGKRGATYMMAGLLEEGAGDLDAAGFRRAAESLAADFGFDAHGDSVSISAKFLSENRGAAVELLRKAINAPRFAKADIDRVRAQVITIIDGDRKDPQEIAMQAFDARAYGPDHPYGTPSTGSEASVNLLSREDIVTAYRNAIARDRVHVAAVGDITPTELGRILDLLLGDLPATGAPMPPKAEVTLTGGISVIDFPSPQSVAIFGHAGIGLHDPDFFAAYLVNQVFGAGGFTSRLNAEVREKRGLTYGVYTYLGSYDLANVFVGSVASANERIAEAIDVIRAEWKRAAENGITEAELRAAKEFLTGAYPLRFDGNTKIASILVGMQLDGLPRDYPLARNDRINAVTLAEANRVARRLLQPDQLRFIVVGQPVGVESGD